MVNTDSLVMANDSRPIAILGNWWLIIGVNTTSVGDNHHYIMVSHDHDNFWG